MLLFASNRIHSVEFKQENDLVKAIWKFTEPPGGPESQHAQQSVCEPTIDSSYEDPYPSLAAWATTQARKRIPPDVYFITSLLLSQALKFMCLTNRAKVTGLLQPICQETEFWGFSLGKAGLLK